MCRNGFSLVGRDPGLPRNMFRAGVGMSQHRDYQDWQHRRGVAGTSAEGLKRTEGIINDVSSSHGSRKRH